MKRKAQVQGMRAALMLLALFCCLTGVRAEEVTVGDVNSNDYSKTLPMNSYYKYSYSQQIYTAEEIGKEGAITSLTLWLRGVSNLPEMTFDIYMVETDKGTFDDNQWEPTTEGDKVYSGKVTVHNTDFEPYTFTLDTPFDYSGQGNLMIAFDNRTGTCSSWLEGKVFQKDNNDNSYVSLDCSNDDHAFDPDDYVYWAGYRKKYRNVIKLDITPSPIARPDIVTATDITFQGATLNWTGGTGKYNLEYKKADASTWTNAKKGLTSTTLPLYILEQNTAYKARVQSVSGAVVSGWRSTTFTTPMLYDAPADLACTAVTATTATLSWADDDTFSSWQICLNDNESNIIDASSNTYALQGLTPETTYSAKVRGIGEEGHGIWSDPIRFEPTAKLIIGSDTDTNYGLPTNTSSNYSLSQQIYTVSELGGAATIQSIDFYSTARCTRNLDVYMMSTDRGSFTGINDLFNVTAGDLVFSGSVDFAEKAWTTIELDKPFVYDGQRNVVIVVDDNTGKSSGYVEFRGFNTQSMQNYHRQYSDDVDPTGSLSSRFSGSSYYWKNQIRVKKVDPTVEMPQSLTVGNITFSEADLTWTGGTGRYKVAFKKDGEETWTYSAEKTQPSYHLYNLEENTTYKARVQSVGQGGAVSLWSAVNFTTPYRYPAPSNLAYTSLTSSSATLSWTENGTATTWEICLNDDEETIVTTDSNPFMLDGLTEDATYSVQVRAVCGENKSLWSDAVIFEPTDKLLIGTYMDSSYYLPAYVDFWGDGQTQQIYTKEELGAAGSIMSIDFFNTSQQTTRKLDIYMVNTDKSSFDVMNDKVGYSDADLVYSGEVNFLYKKWTTITLQYPFDYDGQQNVVIIVDEKTSDSNKRINCRVFNAPGQALYKYPASSSSYDLQNVKNQIRLVKAASHTVPKPQNFIVSSLSATAAELTWAGGSGYYNVEYKKESDETWTRVLDNKSYTTCDLVGLEQNTNYIARVQSVSGNAVSGWLPIRFTTPILYAAPVNLACTAVTATTATMSWTEKGSATAWQICLNDDEEHLVSANSNPFTLTGLTAETVYTAKVRSLGTEGHGVWSTPISFEPTEKLILGNGNEKSSVLPTHSWYDYSLTQQIYTKEELGDPATFTSIDFYNTSSVHTRQLDIYMMYTDKSGFSVTSDLAYPTSTYRVFRGEVTFEADAWTTITLDKPFAYDGESNVVMVIDDNTGSNFGSSYFRTYSANKQAVYIYSDNTDFDPAIQSSYYISNYKNQIRIAKSDYPATPIPQMLTATDITPTSATISWRGIAEKFRVRRGIKGSWLKYDNGKVKRSSGAGGSQTWGVKFLAEDVTGNRLTKLSIYESGHNTADITVNIYSKGDKDYIPGTLLKSITVTPEGANAFHEISLDEPLTITKGEPLWITLTTTGQFVMPSCMPNNIKEGTQWIKKSGNWKELKDDHMEGYAWMIRAYMGNSSVQWLNGTIQTSKNFITLSNLNPETDYVYSVQSMQSKSGTSSSYYYSSEVSSSFTTLSSLAEPNSLAVDNITHNSADLSWTGYQEKYNVRLKTLQQLNVSAMGSFTQVGSDITTTAALTPYTFDLSAYSGTGAIAIRHYNIIDMDILAVNNIMVTDANGETVLTEDFESGQIPADWICVDYDGDKQGWYAYQSNAGNRLAISRSWNGNALRPDNWMIIPDVPMGGSLTLYAYGLDAGYPSEVFGVYVSTAEDVVIPATTTRVNNITTNAYTFSNLKPMTTYIVQVQGVHATEGNTSWSNEETFTTGFLTGDVNASGDVTPADAIMILYNYFGVAQTGFIKKAADLNGDRRVTPADAIEALYLYFGASSSSGGAGARATTPTTIDVREPE